MEWVKQVRADFDRLKQGGGWYRAYQTNRGKAIREIPDRGNDMSSETTKRRSNLGAEGLMVLTTFFAAGIFISLFWHGKDGLAGAVGRGVVMPVLMGMGVWPQTLIVLLFSASLCFMGLRRRSRVIAYSGFLVLGHGWLVLVYLSCAFTF